MLPASPAAAPEALRTLSGSDSREPPNSEDGARARTEALVSSELRRRARRDEEASVRIDALSVSRLLAVAVEYDVGFGVAPPAAEDWPMTCGGMADAGAACGSVRCGGAPPAPVVVLECDVVAGGVGCALPPPGIRVFGAADWMVVRVVVRERTEGAGEEKVLPSPPAWWAEAAVPAPVVVVPVLDCAASECVVPGFVETVGATDLFPGGNWDPSWDTGRELRLCDGEPSRQLRPDGGVENERWPRPEGASV